MLSRPCSHGVAAEREDAASKNMDREICLSFVISRFLRVHPRLDPTDACHSFRLGDMMIIDQRKPIEGTDRGRCRSLAVLPERANRQHLDLPSPSLIAR